jgi:hypothetical protein
VPPPAPAQSAQVSRTIDEDGAISADRRRQIDAWVKTQATNNTWNSFAGDAHDKVAGALRGENDLGGLNDDEKRYLVDRALTKWVTVGDGYNSAAPSELAGDVKDDRHLAAIVAERCAQKAAEPCRVRQPNSKMPPRAFRSGFPAGTDLRSANSPAGTRGSTADSCWYRCVRMLRVQAVAVARERRLRIRKRCSAMRASLSCYSRRGSSACVFRRASIGR